MEQFTVVTFIIAIASFIGVLIGPALSGLVRLRELQHEAKQQAQQDRVNYLRETQMKLIDTFAMANTVGNNARILGLILSVDDEQIQSIGESKDPLRDKANKTIIRLGQMIKAEMKSQ